MPRKNTTIWHFPHVPVLIISTFYLFLVIKNKFFINSRQAQLQTVSVLKELRKGETLENINSI